MSLVNLDLPSTGASHTESHTPSPTGAEAGGAAMNFDPPSTDSSRTETEFIGDRA